MDKTLLAFAEQPAPRYTSYPSAPHFTDKVNGAVVQRWLGEIEPQSALSLYIHVPYCREICWYCGCNTFAARRDGPVLDYVATLLREIDLVAAALSAKRVVDIHWGGGTPNILRPSEFVRVIERLRSVFDLSALAHHAIELDPRSLDEDKCAAYVAAGVNRVSLGVQDLNRQVQEAIGRIQPRALVQDAARMLRAAGIETLSMDLMYGLPHQSIDDLRRSVRWTAAMAPQRIALFGYAHVPWFRKRQRLIKESALPGAAERFDQAEAARADLAALGYEAIGLDHFALPDDELAIAARSGGLRRSFQGYVTDTETSALVGLGPSSISTLPQGYAQASPQIGAWARDVQAGVLPIARGHAPAPADRKRRRLIEQIMCDFAGDLRLIGGRATCSNELAALSPLIAAGLAVLDGERVLVPEHARQFCRLVARVFDAYATQPAARHSRAV